MCMYAPVGHFTCCGEIITKITGIIIADRSRTCVYTYVTHLQYVHILTIYYYISSVNYIKEALS